MKANPSHFTERCSLCGHHSLVTRVTNCVENLGLLGGRYSYAECNHCHVISQIPQPSPELLNRYYNLIDQRQKRWWSSPAGRSLGLKLHSSRQSQPSPLVSFFRRIATAGEEVYPYWNHLKPGCIVDLGAGSGGFCIEARQRGWDVTGIEQSPASVEVARRMGIDLIQEDLGSSAARELIRSADNVVLNHVFEHVVEPLSFLRSLRSTMQTDSHLILLIPNPNSLWRFVFGRRWYGWDPPVHVHHYSPAALKRILRGQGFRIVELRTIRRNDSLAAGLNQIGINTGRFRLLLRVLMMPVMPMLAWTGFAPEILCVAEIDRNQKAKLTNDAA